MNIILVIFDSLRKDSMGVYGAAPWGELETPHFQAFAEESLILTRAYPESLPTLPTRRAIYTGQRVYPFHNADYRLKGDFVGAPGWGPIPENQATLAEMLSAAGYRTGLISDVYHQFKPSKNFWRGFDQWMFLRGQERDPYRSGPRLTQEEVDYWLPKEMQNEQTVAFIQQAIMNMHDRTREEEYFAPRVLRESALWLQQNRDADQVFLTVESFNPHEPWLVPAHYRDIYLEEPGQEQVKSSYADVSDMDEYLLNRTRVNYKAAVTLCDRWFGHFMESLRVLGMLDDSVVILTSDHGHSIGDRGYMGKRGYPSAPEVYDVPLMVRFPGAEHAGVTSDMFVQHHDVTGAILDLAEVEPPEAIDGFSFLDAALSGEQGMRDHATVAWGSAATVITRNWWLNYKLDRTGFLLYDLTAEDPFATNVASEHPDIVHNLMSVAEEDADGPIPDWILGLARNQADAPGCSALAARE